MIALIIPTIRQIDEWYKAWKPQLKDIQLYIIEDKKEKTIKVPEECKHYSWKEIDEDLKDKSWIISRHNSGIRSYGFYKAYKDKADIIITMDDDCFPINGDELNRHILNLKSKGCISWYNPLEQGYSRGFPYDIRGNEAQIVLSHGLWKGVPDLDAPTSFNPKQLVSRHGVVPRHAYFPMCIMNVAFNSCLVPAMYQLLMGANFEYDRFDDIWSGIIVKKIIDHIGNGVYSGYPHILHKRASNKFDNLIKEAKGIKENENFWKEIDKIQLTEKDYISCYKELWTKFNPYNDYFIKLKEAALIWISLFNDEKH